MKKGPLLLLCLLYICGSFSINARFDTVSYGDFRKATKKLPMFRALYKNGMISLHSAPGSLIDQSGYRFLSVVSLEEFIQVIEAFFGLMGRDLEKATSWFGSTNALQELIDPTSTIFVPYAQKIWVEPGTKLICKGDLHGDMHSLIAFIDSLSERNITSSSDPLTIIDPNYKLIFHGDYVDRGLWGVEVLYLLMLLKIKNPDQVFLVRGNHEDPLIAQQYGFAREFHGKYANIPEHVRDYCYGLISKLYNYLPLVCYIGSGYGEKRNFLQLCHGGIELGYNPKNFLNAPHEKKYHYIQKFEREAHCCLLKEHDVLIGPAIFSLKSVSKDFIAESPMFPQSIGFLWHDFIVNPGQLSVFNPTRGFAFNKALTDDYFQMASTDNVKLFGIIRAHQHTPDNNDPMMRLLLESRGCAALWQKENSLEKLDPYGMVLTLLLSPDSLHGTPTLGGRLYSGFDYDSYAEVTTAPTIPEWTVRVINNDIYTAAAA